MEQIVMYDVRGIQKYIFRTNAVKEIIGASSIVESIITDGLREIINNKNLSEQEYIVDWSGEDVPFLTQENIQMQVMFIGGGNAYVLYRNEDVCSEFNRALARYVLDHTYSLTLAIAAVDKSDSYAKDYKRINEKMQEVKGKMPESVPFAALPFMAADAETGFPLVDKSAEQKKYVSTETKLKLEAYDTVRQSFAVNGTDRIEENILDRLVTEKYDNSILGIVHIDGNSMGNRIKALMQDVESYEEAIPRMRKISRTISNTYHEVFNVMKAEVAASYEKIKKDAIMVRRIVTAGDDITYVVNGKAALSSAEIFIKHLDGKCMYQKGDTPTDEEIRKYGFSACGGVALVHSHFPFSDGYKVAEACCAAAKARAKNEQYISNGMIGNYIDFQICNHISAADISEYRMENYMVQGHWLLKRPYYIPTEKYGESTGLNKKNKCNSFERFRHNIKIFTDKNFPRSIAKNLRNAFSTDTVDEYLTFIKSRQKELPSAASDGVKEDDANWYDWYDALEMLDLFVDITEDEGENDHEN